MPAVATRRAITCWAVLAALNLSAGLAISARPERQSDLANMRRWGQTWLVSGTDLYEDGAVTPNYPPLAIVTLSPLGLVPTRVAVPMWAGLNVALAILAAYLALLAVRPRAPLAELALPLLMFLTWGSFRTLLQFSLLSATLGLAGLVLADRRPFWSGVCLGLSLMKPQIGLPFVLWALFTRRLKPLLTAATIAVAGSLIYCLRAWVSPFGVAARYTKILGKFSTGEVLNLEGVAHLRPLIALVVSTPTFADAIAGAAAIMMLTGICVLGISEGRKCPLVMYSAPALACAWSLLTFYHLTYGFVLLLPAATLLLFADEPETLRRRTRCFQVMQAALMVDPPMVWRWLGSSLPLPSAAAPLFLHADRVLMLALAAFLTALGIRARRR